MTNPHAGKRHKPHARVAPRKFHGRPSNAETTELGPDHYRKPEVRKLQENIAQADRSSAALGGALDADGGKWPSGLVTAGVITATCLLWLLILAPFASSTSRQTADNFSFRPI